MVFEAIITSLYNEEQHMEDTCNAYVYAIKK